MIYYFLPKEKYGKVKLIYERFQLGESSFDNFWIKDGFKIFENILSNEPETLSDMLILDETAKELSAADFLEILKKHKLIYPK